MVKFVVWGPGGLDSDWILENEKGCYLKLPRFESQTNNLRWVWLMVVKNHLGSLGCPTFFHRCWRGANNPFSLWWIFFFEQVKVFVYYLCGVICVWTKWLVVYVASAYLKGLCYKRYHEGMDPKTMPSIQQPANQPTNQPTSFKLNRKVFQNDSPRSFAIEAKLDFNSTYWVGTLPRFIVVNAGLVQDPLLKMHVSW